MSNEKKDLNANNETAEAEGLIGQATDEQIAAWKGKYGEISAIEVGGHICYIRKPERTDIDYSSVGSKGAPLKFNEILMRECWLGGSEEIQRNDGLFLGASGELSSLIEAKTAKLVKL